MRLYVYVLEAKGLPITDNIYAKLQLGKFKFKTRIVNNEDGGGSDPIWNEEFVFRVHDIQDDLVVSIYQFDDRSRLFNASGHLVGRVWIPVYRVAQDENQCLPPTWFNIDKSKHSKRDCGNILLTLSLHGRGDDATGDDPLSVQPSAGACDGKEPESLELLHANAPSPTTSSKKIPQGKKLMKIVTNRLEKLLHKNVESSKSDASSELSVTPECEDVSECESSRTCNSFDEAMDVMHSREDEVEMPENLNGGVLLDKMYEVTSKDLNSALFAPDSQLKREHAEIQGIGDMQEGLWTWNSGESPCLTRIVTYTQPPSKLVKAVKATEELAYVKAAGGEFAVFVTVLTPDVPYGSMFKIELLFKILPALGFSSAEGSSRLIISWAINFSQSTMMKSMIVGGAQQGLKDSFDKFGNLLAQKFKVIDTDDSLEKDHVLAALEMEHQSDWELAIQYFGNITVVSAAFLTIYVIVHILLCESHSPQGLEISGIGLPDSFGQLITCGVLILLLERVYSMISHFIQARVHMRNDNGIKSQGDGWAVTVALVEAVNLPLLDVTRFSDPFVVLTCNGKTRTSSVQLQTCDPQWNEVFEFDASEEPPSVLDVEVFNFDGPFDQAVSLGHAEINFLTHAASDLADKWVPLKGKQSVSSQSKLHLRIFVENEKGVETVKDYLTKMEKEVGKKLNIRSPYENSSFQKLFGFPPEEFLIKDYSCSLRRKILLQGRLFLSARTVGFHSNLFGFKTKFFFLWEDIEDIEVLAPSLSSIGSPTLVIVLRKGKGLDARHGAKAQDHEGRLRFFFQSFLPFDAASRTIIALWRARSIAPEKRELVIEEQQDQESMLITKDRDCLVFLEDTEMLKIYSASFPVDIKSLMKIFEGGPTEHKVMTKSGCLDYVTSQWEEVKPNVYERQLSYKFNHHISLFGGEARCAQRKSSVGDEKGWIVNEVIALNDIPFGNCFQVHLKYKVQNVKLSSDACHCDVYLGISWLKDCKFQQRIIQNINQNFGRRIKDKFELIKKDFISR